MDGRYRKKETYMSENKEKKDLNEEISALALSVGPGNTEIKSRSEGQRKEGCLTCFTFGECGEKKDAISYKTDETVGFRVELRDGEGLIPCHGFKWTLMGDGIITRSGIGDGANGCMELRTALPAPGFVFLNVKVLDSEGKVIDRYDLNCGAGVDITEIEQSYPEPHDFDEVWGELVSRLNKIDPKPTEKKYFASGEKNNNGGAYPLYDDENYLSYDITIPCAEGINPVKAVLTIPKKREGVKGSLGIKISFYGYGCDTAYPECMPDTAVLSVNVHGIENGREPQFYADYRESISGFAQRDGDKKHISEHYLYGVMLRDIQAVRYLFTVPEYDGTGLTVSGGSMGALQSVTVASCICRGYVKGRLKILNIAVPWGADMGKVEPANNAETMKYNIDGVYESRIPRYWGIHAYKKNTLYNYFDIANHIKRVDIPINIEGRLGDYVSPPRSVMTLYNNAKNAPAVGLKLQQNATHGWVGADASVFKLSKTKI